MSWDVVSSRELISFVRAVGEIYHATDRKRVMPVRALIDSMDRSSYIEKNKVTAHQCTTWANDVRDNINCKVYTLRDFLHHQVVSLMTRENGKRGGKYGHTPYYDRDGILNTRAEFFDTRIEDDIGIMQRVVKGSKSHAVRDLLKELPLDDGHVHHDWAVRPLIDGKSVLYTLLSGGVIGHGLYFKALGGYPVEKTYYEGIVVGNPEMVARRFASVVKSVQKPTKGK